jgi:sulfide dehydrogenase [flavocytochrome c] flavoprotein subunit
VGIMRRRTFLSLSGGAAAAALQPRWSAARDLQAAKAKVLIIGGGFAGSACALRLRQLNPELQVTLVDPDETYTCCPMSNGVLVGLRDMQSIRVSRRGLQRSGVHYVRDHVAGIDTQVQRARLSGGVEFAYDRLVMATGIRLLWNRPEGYTEGAPARMPHAWQAGAQTELLAAQLRAISDGGVIAISVPAGPMRCPPGPFERASLFAGYLHRRKPRCKILIFDGNNHFPRQDEFSAAWRSLYPGMIEWISVVDGGAVERVDPERMVVVAGAREHRVEVANIIPPQAPSLLAAQSGLASEHGWCPINPLSFESTLIPNVHVIGDSCIADPMPKAASAACSQAMQCAAAIAASLAGREVPAGVLQSVCYSALSAGTALSIHGRFRSTAEGIVQLAGVTRSAAITSLEARLGAEWFRRTLEQAFSEKPLSA